MSKLIRRGTCLLAGSALFLLLPRALHSHDPITTKLTWNREISRLVYKRCAGCHRNGGSAMDLTTYELARPWAKAIRDEILARRMPPWGAVKGVGDFVDDPTLSQPEIEMLVVWVEGGAPEGDAADLPARLPDFKRPPAARPRYTRTLAVSSDTTLTGPATLVALRPKDLPDHASLDAWAIRPDGTVDRLLWLSDYRKVWTRNYILQSPLALPAGTRLRVASSSSSSGSLLFLCR